MDDEKPRYVRYELKHNDPHAKLLAAFNELNDKENELLRKLDTGDEFQVELFGFITDTPKSEDKKCQVVPLSKGTVIFNFKEHTVQIPQEIVDHHKAKGNGDIGNVDIPAERVRYCGFPWYGDDGKTRNDGRVMLLSLWDSVQEGKRYIQNVFLVAKNLQSAMLLISALTRLIYENCKCDPPEPHSYIMPKKPKSTTRTNRFHAMIEGPIAVFKGSVDDREIRDKFRMAQREKRLAASGNDQSQASGAEAETSRGGGNNDAPGNTTEHEKLLRSDGTAIPPLVTSPVYAILDDESLSLFDHPFSFTPFRMLLFCREDIRNVIENIYICQDDDQLEIQSDKDVYYIQECRDVDESQKEVFKTLVDNLKRGVVRSKPREYFFSGTEKDFETFFSGGYYITRPRLPRLPGSLDGPAVESRSTPLST